MLLAVSLVMVPFFFSWMLCRGTGVFTRLRTRLSTRKPPKQSARKPPEQSAEELEDAAYALEVAADVLKFKASIQDTRARYLDYVRLRAQLSEQTADAKDELQNALWGIERGNEQIAASMEEWKATLARGGADVSELQMPTYEEAEQAMYMEDAEREVELYLRT